MNGCQVERHEGESSGKEGVACLKAQNLRV